MSGRGSFFPARFLQGEGVRLSLLNPHPGSCRQSIVTFSTIGLSER